MKPRGHFMITWLDLFPLLGILLFGIIPALAVVSLIVLAVLKVWFAFSWYWLALPAGVLILWLLLVAYLRS